MPNSEKPEALKIAEGAPGYRYSAVKRTLRNRQEAAMELERKILDAVRDGDDQAERDLRRKLSRKTYDIRQSEAKIEELDEILRTDKWAPIGWARGASDGR